MPPIRGLVLSAIAMTLLASVPARPARSADTPSALESSPEGWTDLLAEAGPQLKGWTRLPVKPGGTLQSETKSQWSLDPKTGVLLCEGDGGHEWLRYDTEVGDGIFHVEWRFVPVAGDHKKGYNSGIYVRNSADAKIWHQAQTGDASGGFLFGDTPAHGDLKRINLSKGVRVKAVKPAGEWNTFEITCKGKHLSLWVNGVNTCEFDACEIPRGYLGVEAEGYRIEFKNVKLKRLD
jgi:hypothetical protein